MELSKQRPVSRMSHKEEEFFEDCSDCPICKSLLAQAEKAQINDDDDDDSDDEFFLAMEDDLGREMRLRKELQGTASLPPRPTDV
jgi:hypothetical protein